MARHDKQMNIRMAHENLNAVKKAAEINRLSIAAQINAIVEDWRRIQEQKESAKA